MLLNRFALGLLFTGLAAGQTQNHTFFLSHPASNADLNSLVTMVRTVVDVRDIVADEVQNALVASKVTVEQSMATEWLLNQIYLPNPTAAYTLAGTDGEVIRVFRLDPASTNANMTGMVTAIRTVADAQRMFPFEPERAIAVRTSKAKMAATEWLIQEATKPATESVTKSSEYAFNDDRGPEVVKVFHLRKGTSNADLTGMVTLIRTVADVQRLFPMGSTAAVIMRGPANGVAIAEWLIDDLTQPAGSSDTSHETKMQGLTDGVVRVFYLNHRKTNADLTSLITQLRTTTEMQRMFPYSGSSAIVLRGRADQVSMAQSLVAKFDTEAK